MDRWRRVQVNNSCKPVAPTGVRRHSRGGRGVGPRRLIRKHARHGGVEWSATCKLARPAASFSPWREGRCAESREESEEREGKIESSFQSASRPIESLTTKRPLLPAAGCLRRDCCFFVFRLPFVFACRPRVKGGISRWICRFPTIPLCVGRRGNGGHTCCARRASCRCPR